MQRLLLIFSFFLCLQSSGQKAYLFIKKNNKKVRSFPEGSYLTVQTPEGRVAGYMMLLKNDSIFIGGRRLHVNEVQKIILPKPESKIDLFNAAVTTVGVFTIAYFAAKFGPQTFTETLIISSAVGYWPLIRRLLKDAFRKDQYRVGRKFKIQVFDLRPS